MIEIDYSKFDNMGKKELFISLIKAEKKRDEILKKIKVEEKTIKYLKNKIKDILDDKLDINNYN